MSSKAPLQVPLLDLQAQYRPIRDEILAAIDRELAAMAEQPPRRAEVEKAKAIVETDFWISLVDVDGKAEALGHYETALGDFRKVNALAERLGQATTSGIKVAVDGARWVWPTTISGVIQVPCWPGRGVAAQAAITAGKALSIVKRKGACRRTRAKLRPRCRRSTSRIARSR